MLFFIMRQILRKTFFWKLLRQTKAILIKSKNRFELIPLSPLIAQLSKTPDFPGSSATNKQWLEISILGYTNTFPKMLEIAKLNKPETEFEIKRAADIFEVNSEVLELRDCFDFEGSDKGSKHQYDLIYANMLKNRRHEELLILEIGIGSNNTDTPSNMGKIGIPGASLRAWRNFLPNATVIGCDVDARILFREDRIATYELDQMSEHSWAKLYGELIGKSFDLIVDDGLHSPFPNLVTVKKSLPLLKETGILVIEDVLPTALPVWGIMKILLAPVWTLETLETAASNVVIIKRS